MTEQTWTDARGGELDAQRTTVAQAAAGLGLGWTRVAQVVGDRLPLEDIDQIWLFPPVRREEREWGTAVLARRIAVGRVRVYTAGYMLVLRGRERGQGRVQLEEVGESPDDVLPDVLRGVQERAGESEPPVAVDVSLWYPERAPHGDEPTAPR